MSSRATRRRTSLIAAMVLSVLAVSGLTFWDADRESAAALQDFAQEQATLAEALACVLRIPSQEHSASDQNGVLAALRAIERPHVLVLLQHRRGESTFRTTDGRRLQSPRLLTAIDEGQTVVRLTGHEAEGFGLNRRMALAGIARIDNVATGGANASWDIVALASAERQRDRERWARERLFLSVLAAVGLVVVFGGVAMRNQRKELLLERELALTGLQQSGDERLQRASKAAIMGTLAMGVAHEISTPLGVIVARGEQLLSRLGHDRDATDGVTAILAQTDRIDQVMRGLLGLARGDAPSAERVEPGQVVANAVALVEHRFAKSGIALTQDVAPGLPAVLGDGRLLEHAVVNLLLNAADACKMGGTAAIRARKVANEIELAVEDTGTGISPADVGRALEPFFTTKSREGGTGLGLAIVHEIVQNHRGRLVFTPLAPRGTRAAILLPPAPVL